MEFEEFYDIMKIEFGDKLSKESRATNTKGKKCLQELYNKYIKDEKISEEEIKKFKYFYQIGIFFGRTIGSSESVEGEEGRRKDLNKKINEMNDPALKDEVSAT